MWLSAASIIGNVNVPARIQVFKMLINSDMSVSQISASRRTASRWITPPNPMKRSTAGFDSRSETPSPTGFASPAFPSDKNVHFWDRHHLRGKQSGTGIVSGAVAPR